MRKTGAHFDFLRTNFTNGLNRPMNMKPKKIWCMMLTLVTNLNIEKFENLHKLLGCREKYSVLDSPLVRVRSIGSVWILVTPFKKIGGESGAAWAAPASPIPTALYGCTSRILPAPERVCFISELEISNIRAPSSTKTVRQLLFALPLTLYLLGYPW